MQRHTWLWYHIAEGGFEVKDKSLLGALRLGLWRITGILAAVGLLAACASQPPEPGLLTPEAPVEDLVIAPVTSETDPLDGTRWRLLAFESQEQAPVIPEEPDPVVEFQKGVLSLHTGCNEVYGHYIVQREQITVTFAEGTLVDCSDQYPGVNEVEQAFLEAMPAFESYVTGDDQLRIQYAGGVLLLSRFEAASAHPAVPATSVEVDLLEDVQRALVAYVPVADAQTVVTTLLSSIADWLAAGGEPATLETILNEMPLQFEHKPVTVTELDLTGDGRQDVVVRIPVMGLPVLVLVNEGGTPAQFGGYALPPELEAIRTDFPLEGTEIDKPAVQLEDLTGDGVPEVLFTSLFPGASSYRLRPNAFQWHDRDFRLIFAADLVSWAGTSDYALEPDPSAGGSLQVVLTYPHLYSHGFDHKMVNHPPGRQVWCWNSGLEKFVLSEEHVDLEQSAWQVGLPVTAGDRLRWLTNEAEAAFRTGAYGEALRGYREVLRQADEDDWQPQEGEADWQSYAAFRRAETLLLLGQPSSGLPEMAVLSTEMGDDLLGQLARAFLEGYGDGVASPAGPDAAARGVAAMQAVDLYSHFYYEHPGALRFPMDAGGILYPGAGLAAYLNAHAGLASDLPALHSGLTDAGFAVEGIVPAMGGSLLITLRLPGLPYAGEERVPWLLTEEDATWRVSLPGSEEEWPTVGWFGP
jgi:heat shock protein HslJ